LLWLRNRLETGAIACGANDFRRGFFWLQILHGNHFLDTMPMASMSLCKTDCWLRLSHFNVTPDSIRLGDRGLIVLVVTPANASADA
jgi:hypothetical protein